MAIHELHTEIEIDAPAERVWEILVDFTAYPQWNPFIRSIQGTPIQGKRLRVEIQPSGSKPMRFSPTVLAAEAGRELRWLGRVLFPGLFDGKHAFIIEPLGEDKVRFQQNERFSGILVGLFRSSLDSGTKRGFEEMNQALKQRAEERSQPDRDAIA
ncbi:SRPBCC domain-containing protein [Sulfurimonas sp. HSL-3221]|uniref:SRPBCC domain-containing protein n=1 Tax=Sulfurimonadaceae TaxID=2771471 RepID=UPI001E443247|nr:SRPBCC domain-containing protein [Sulfurimonas sp. HSL-3221]UFS63351.1 SRPBCC domain-containing protein [Sulfurimonas sp. HSL-3221]